MSSYIHVWSIKKRHVRKKEEEKVYVHQDKKKNAGMKLHRNNKMVLD